MNQIKHIPLNARCSTVAAPRAARAAAQDLERASQMWSMRRKDLARRRLSERCLTPFTHGFSR
jgi:hypothetical protein